ncbi:unnamed protein product, partial [Staurois parvus]
PPVPPSSATHLCPEVPPTCAHQCYPPVPTSDTQQCCQSVQPSSAASQFHHQCLAVLPVSVQQ